MKREVGAALEVEVTAPTTLEFQIAVAPHPNTEVCESLSFVLDGKPIQPIEISGVHGNTRPFSSTVGSFRNQSGIRRTGRQFLVQSASSDRARRMRSCRLTDPLGSTCSLLVQSRAITTTRSPSQRWRKSPGSVRS
jgi:hypothetical protein